MHSESPIARCLGLLSEHGSGSYFGEAVSQTEHMLQSAQLGAAEGAPASLVAAALLHDIGHLVHTLGEDVAERGVDAMHERIGANWLARWFPLAVVEPIRLHVEAKRYLCHADPTYLEKLAPPSLQSLGLQGGSMTHDEATGFLEVPFAVEAIRLRRWDDHAKVAGAVTPSLEDMRGVLEAAIGDGASS